LGWGFDNFDRIQILKRGEPLPVHVQVQSGGIIQPVSQNDISVILPKRRVPDVRLKYDIPPVITGPVAGGDAMGHITVLDGGETMTTVDAICPFPMGEGQFHQITSGVTLGNETRPTVMP